MNCLKWKPLPVVVLVVLVIAAATGDAQVDLRFDPPDTTVAAGENCRLSIMLDAELEVRTIDLTVTYDTTVVRSLGGGAGTLYTDSGIFTFDGFEEDTPGQWHGYAVLMGSGLFVLGPGELYTWDFEALADGTTAITAIGVYLSTTDGSWFEEVLLPAATVTVGDGGSSVPETPLLQTGLSLWPNPFNPRTKVSFDLLHAARVNLSVFDVSGRRVAVLLSAHVDAGPLTAEWDGRHADGRAAPGGTYLFRLDGPGIHSVTKGNLVK